MSEQFFQEQINQLQVQHEALRNDVTRATEAAYDNKKTLQSVHKRLDEIDHDMLTAAQMDAMLDRKFNEQVVKGLKWALGLVGAVIVTKWAEFMDWFK